MFPLSAETTRARRGQVSDGEATCIDVENGDFICQRAKREIETEGGKFDVVVLSVEMSCGMANGKHPNNFCGSIFGLWAGLVRIT